MKDTRCDCCPYRDMKYVPASGRVTSDIAIIGEAPGKQEELQGIPFVGGAGRVLNMLLNNAGILRQDCYVTNVIKCRPPGNNINTADAHKAITCCKSRFEEELRSLQCKVLVPTGNTPLAALGIAHKITEIRGTVLMTPWGKVIPTFHPAYVMRQWDEYVTCTYDWAKIRDHLTIKGLVEVPEDFTLSPTIEQVEEFTLSILDRANHEPISIGLDIETFICDTPLHTPVKVVGISVDSMTAMVIPFITQSGNAYWNSRDQAVRAISAIAKILEHDQIEKVVHNVLFDLLVLSNLGFNIRGPVYDTMVGRFLVYNPSPLSLAYCVSIYTDYPAWKLDKGQDDLSFRRYNARDAIVLHLIKPKLDEDIRSNGVGWVFHNTMLNVMTTARMTLNGIHIEKDRLREVSTQLRKDSFALNHDLVKLSGDPEFNPNSPKQLEKLLFKTFKLKSAVKTKTGVLSTGKDVLNRLSLRYPGNEFITKLLQFRNIDKLFTTYGDPPILSDGRVHSQFKLTIVTGRYGSSNPNVQNLPSKRGDPQGYIRKMYTAGYGNIIVCADFSQAELVTFATITNDGMWLKCFENGDDVHELNGIALTGSYDPRYRTFYKNFIFGYIYGSEGSEIEKVAPKELISRLDIKQMITNFNSVHPNMFLYREQIKRQITDTHRVKNPFGRTRWFPGVPTKEDIRAGYNHPVQSTVAEMMHQKMPLIEAELGDTDKIILQLHDALYVECPILRAPVVAGIMKSVMEQPVYAPNGMTFKLKVKCESGPSLGELQEI